MANNELKFVLTAVTQGFTQKLQEAGNQVRSFSDGVTAQFKGIRDSIGNVGNIMAAMGAVRMMQVVDEATMVGARLKDVTGSAEGAKAAQGELYSSAQRLRVGYADLAGSVAKMLPSIQALGGGTREAMKLAEVMAMTAKLSGASAHENTASQQQFAQAMASGVLQGDELKSILENNSALARSMAEGLGVGVGELRRLGSEGKLTADVVAGALIGQYDEIKARSADLPMTVGGAWTQVQNAFQSFMADLNEGTGIFTGVAALLTGLSKIIDAVKFVLMDTGTEADKLGNNKSIATWGETVGAIFAYVIDLGRSVWVTITSVSRALGGLAAATMAALGGDLAGAANILENTWADLSTSGQKIADLLTGGKGSTLLAYATGAGSGTGSSGDDNSQINQIRTELNAVREKYKQTHSMREMSKQQELAALKQIASQHKLDAEDQIRLGRMVATAEIAARNEVAAKGKGGKKGGSAAAPAEPSQMPQIQAELEAERLKYMQTNALREMSKMEELQVLEQIAAQHQLKAKDQVQLKKMVAAAEIAALKEMAEQGRQLDEGERTSRMDKAMNAVNAAQFEAESQLALGQITKAEMLEQERLFEEQRNQIQRQALTDRLATADPTRDPVLYAQLLSQLEQLEAQHQQRLGQIRLQAMQEQQAMSMQIGNSLQGGFARVFSQIGTSITSIGGLMRAMGQVVLQTFVQLLSQMAAKWLVNKLLMKAISKSTAFGEIAAEAGKAGAGGVASMAAAPFPLNLSAPAFGASMSALAMSFAPMASASAGFDIPAGVNPITQLHQREMVLPAKHADVIRSLADGQGGADGGGVVHFHDYNGLSDSEIERKAHVIADKLNKLHRNGWRPR